MSKSTPLNALPTANVNPIAQPTPAPGFVNDTQRQMVMQAQQAAQGFQLPQSSNDVIVDDDATINDVLNQFNGNNAQTENHLVPPQLQTQPALLQTQPTQGYNLMETMTNDPSAMYGNQMSGFQQPNINMMESLAQHSNIENNGFLNDPELKIALYAIGVFFIVSVLPVDTFINRYVALQKVPYSNVLVRALLAGIVIYLLAKYLK
jgi:hypothetical protein